MNLLKNTISRLSGLAFLSFLMTSCLGHVDPVEYSADATIHSFELDKVLGVNYKFTIDHAAGKIYNVDSLPVQSDTIIDRILITKMEVFGGAQILNDAGKDSLLNMNDSLDLRGTMEILPDGTPGKPLRIKTWAPDAVHNREYRLSVRVHQQHADSLSWGVAPVAQNISDLSGDMKLVALNEQVYAFYQGNHTQVATAPALNPASWSTSSVNGLPADFDYNSILSYDNRLFTTTASGEVYESADALNWQKNETLSAQQVKCLLVAFPATEGAGRHKVAGLAAVLTGADGLRSALSDAQASTWEKIAAAVPEKFPMEHCAASLYKSNLEVPTAIVVGDIPAEQVAESDTSTVVWTTTDGTSWYPLRTESELDCPKVKNPSVLYYGDRFYVFGRNFETFYSSKDGLTWKAEDKRFLFPESIRGKESNYACWVDERNFIWLLRETPNELWKGRLNVLGFKVR